MILPVYAASSGSRPRRSRPRRTWAGGGGRTTFRKIVLPLVLPAVAAGSIFTFSLTLGDYITPELVVGTRASFLGTVIYLNQGTANNVPFAATFAIVPIGIMAIYLLIAQAPGRLRCPVRRAAARSG